MHVDVLVEGLAIDERGTTRDECPGLLMLQVRPAVEAAYANPGGRPLALKKGEAIRFTGFQEQLELRAPVHGKFWLEVAVVSLTRFGFLEKLAAELLSLGKDKWPLPLGKFLFDGISEDIKQGAPQIVAAGRSPVIPLKPLPRKLEFPLYAPSNVFSEPEDNVFPRGDEPLDRRVVLAEGSRNGSICLKVQKA